MFGRIKTALLALIFSLFAATATAQPFITQSMDFPLTGTPHLDLGASPFAGSSKLTLSFSVKSEYSGWSDSERPLIAVNAPGQRQLLIAATKQLVAPYNALRIAFSGDGTTLQSAYVGPTVFSGKWWHQITVAKNGATVVVYVDGVARTLQNSTGAFPVTLASSTSTLQIGAQGLTHTPRWYGQISDVAMWLGWTASATHARALWSYDEAVDVRAIPGFPQPTIYVPANTFPPVEVVSARPMTGSVSPSSKIPGARLSSDTMFVRRVLLNKGTEPWMNYTIGGGGNYSASPSVVRDSLGRLLWAYSRGVEHVNYHRGYFSYSDDDGVTFALSARANPYDPIGRVEQPFPHGDLSGPTTSKRSFSLSRDSLVGISGRIFAVINETYYPGTQGFIEGRTRVWTFYSDTDGDTWSPGVEFMGAGTMRNSVGRAKVVRLPDGSHVFGYYLRNNGEGCYDAAIARSVDDGATWAHWQYVAQAPDRNAGARFEEPFLGWVDGKLRLQIRVDSGSHPDINGGALMNGKILASVSPDGGTTFPLPQVSYVGHAHPIFLYRESDGLLVALNRAEFTSGPVLLISRNKGLTWSAPIAIPSPYSALYMQGDLTLTADGRILALFAQEHDGFQQTAMWSGEVSDAFLSSIETPLSF